MVIFNKYISVFWITVTFTCEHPVTPPTSLALILYLSLALKKAQWKVRKYDDYSQIKYSTSGHIICQNTKIVKTAAIEFKFSCPTWNSPPGQNAQCLRCINGLMESQCWRKTLLLIFERVLLFCLIWFSLAWRGGWRECNVLLCVILSCLPWYCRYHPYHHYMLQLSG